MSGIRVNFFVRFCLKIRRSEHEHKWGYRTRNSTDVYVLFSILHSHRTRGARASTPCLQAPVVREGGRVEVGSLRKLVTRILTAGYVRRFVAVGTICFRDISKVEEAVIEEVSR